MDPRHACQNFNPSHPRYPHQNFNQRQFYGTNATHAKLRPTPNILNPHNPRHSRQNLTHATHANTQPRCPRWLADSLSSINFCTFEFSKFSALNFWKRDIQQFHNPFVNLKKKSFFFRSIS